jgi:response regulator RpfG family c-di-GMP phosphodiesterase
MEYIQAHTGTYFDPAVVETFVAMMREDPYL